METQNHFQYRRNYKAGGITLIIFILSVICSPERSEAKLNTSGFDFGLSSGYRVDQLDWNFAGYNSDFNYTNIRSELTWEDLEINQFNTHGNVTLKHDNIPFGLSFRGTIGYGKIHSGKNQDSDYHGNNRTQEFSRSNNRSDEGDVRDFSAGLGPVFTTREGNFSITPCIGYSYHEQNLTIHDGYQTISEPGIDPSAAPLGPITGLDSTFDTQWYGGWLGVVMEFAPTTNFSLHSSIELHSGTYEAEANWNLIPYFQHPVSFRHYSDDAKGLLINLGLMTGAKNLQFKIDLGYQKWQAEDGQIKFYEEDGDIYILKLNEVNWESFSAMAGVTLRF